MNENMNKTINRTTALTGVIEKEAEEVDSINKKNETSKYRNLYVIIEQVDGNNYSCWS